MNRIAISIYPSYFAYESRILKITETLTTEGIFNKVFIIAKGKDCLPVKEYLDQNREVIRIRNKIGPGKARFILKILRRLEWHWYTIQFLRDKRIDCINCHSLEILGLCVFLKLIKRAKLVYDASELETEQGKKGIRKFILKLKEKIFIRFVNEVINVTDLIAAWYKKSYRLEKVWIVKNATYSIACSQPKTRLLRDKFGILDNEILFLYQGGITVGRGIKLLLNVFSQLKENKHIVFLGYGPLVETIDKYTRLFANIHYHPPVKPDELFSYTASADVGLCVLEKMVPSHFFTCPTKIFEYLNCGLPIIVSNCLPAKKIIQDYNCGWEVACEDEAVDSLIISITRDIIDAKRKNSLNAREYFGWEFEKPVLINVYRKLGF